MTSVIEKEVSSAMNPMEELRLQKKKPKMWHTLTPSGSVR